ncbi:hypothetical protein DC20_02855 [Rufibacter tibetensis]|uniref:Uncharacterized protein n=1 Tax=Rufibacter tibetensis TaxID=512763 RepID=A0A0P0CSG1_9BACT|nr:hypothetical protein DC20_02855 [Rufibacter tibetensis]
MLVPPFNARPPFCSVRERRQKWLFCSLDSGKVVNGLIGSNRYVLFKDTKEGTLYSVFRKLAKLKLQKPEP